MIKINYIAACAAFAMTAGAADAASFVNGSFESGPNPGGFTTLSAGDTSITGWTVTGSSVDYIGSYWQAADGSRSLDLSGNAAGGVEQTIATVAGQSYKVTFDLAGNPDGAPTIKTIDVTYDGGSAAFNFDTTGHTESSMGWTPESFVFTATGASTTFDFSSADATPYGPALDNVSISAVPEPATWAVMTIGLIGLGGVLRRRRRLAVAA